MRTPEPPPKYDILRYIEAVSALRKINKYFESGDLTDIKYYYWDKCKFIAKDWNIDPLLLWVFIKSQRLSNKIFNLDNIIAFSIGSPSIVQRHLHNFDMNL